MNDEFIKATQSADHLISPAVIESGLKDLTFDEWRELLYNFPQFAPRYYWRTQRPESWREMRFVPQQFAVSVDWVLSNGGNWAQILDENPALFRERCNWAELTGCNWAWLLKWKPELQDICHWDKLTEEDRRRLLKDRPEFVEKFSDLSFLNENDWLEILCSQPEYENKVDWGMFSGASWVILLSKNPQFADKCQWNKLRPVDWRNLLLKRPEFAERCDWRIFSAMDWVCLLRRSSWVADKCDWRKLDERPLPSMVRKVCGALPLPFILRFSSWWDVLFRYNPEYSKYRDWAKHKDCLYGSVLWRRLLDAHPEIFNERYEITLDGSGWVDILIELPEFGELCPWPILDFFNWCKLLSEQPQFINKCRCLEITGIASDNNVISHKDRFRSRLAKFPYPLNDDQEASRKSLALYGLIVKQPQFAETCLTSELLGSEWVSLILVQPDVARRCDWVKLNGKDWSRLLREKPEFSDKCEWGELSGFDWAALLSSQPHFAVKLEWTKLRNKDIVALVCKHPYFADRCNWAELSGADWASLLSSQPQFADKCEWAKLSECDWVLLLCKQPQLVDKCNLSDFSGPAWASFLGFQPKFADKCDWDKLYAIWPDIVDWQSEDYEKEAVLPWVTLLKAQPQFADKCDWLRLNGKAWTLLLRELPQYAEHCNWETLYEITFINVLREECEYGCEKSETEQRQFNCWLNLLENQPQFAQNCDWTRLAFRGWEWARLLARQPQFAERCDWGCLSRHDWQYLISQQPQFRAKHKPNILRVGYDKYKAKGFDLLTIDENRTLGKPGLRLLFSELKQDIKSLYVVFRNDLSFCKSNLHRNDVKEQREFDGVDWSVWLCMVSPEDTSSNWHYRMQESDWDKLDGKDWVGLLRWKPNLAKYCRWSKLDGSNWARLLEMYPEFAGKCDWEKTKNWTSRDWAMLIRSKPEYATFERMQTFTGSDWSIVLSRQPSLAKDELLVKLQGKDWVALILSQPQFAKKCDWRKLNADDWIKLLKKQPEFADKCNFGSFEGEDIFKLALAMPKMAEQCNLDRLYESISCGNEVHSWFSELIIIDKRELFEIQEKCDWARLSEQDLLWIMRKCLAPIRFALRQGCASHKRDSERLANATWSDLMGEDIVRLLSSFPQLSTKVDLMKLTVSNWVDLLEIQPTLIGKCGQLKPQIDEEMRRRECERQEQKVLARERYEFENDNSFVDIEDNPYYVDGVPVYGAEDQEDADIIYWNTH